MGGFYAFAPELALPYFAMKQSAPGHVSCGFANALDLDCCVGTPRPESNRRILDRKRSKEIF